MAALPEYKSKVDEMMKLLEEWYTINRMILQPCTQTLFCHWSTTIIS